MFLRHDSPDSSEADRFVQSTFEDLFAEVTGHELAVLQNPAVEIDDIEAAIGADCAIDGSESFVCRAEKCARPKIGVIEEALFPPDLDSVSMKVEEGHQVAGRFGNEDPAPVGGVIGVASVDFEGAD